jgi:hypothetical protein
MSLGHALYYPYINLTNKNWIKHALLFWDTISRIVPYSVEPSDDEDIIKIKYESDFIKDYQPDRWDTSNAFNSFGRVIEPYLMSDRFLHDRIAQHGGEHLYKPHDRRTLLTSSVKENGTYIHIDKLDYKLKELLLEMGVAIPGKDQWEDWIKIDNEIGLLYMTYFAKSISKNKSLPIVTDIEQSFSASLYFESSINSDYNSQFEYKLGNLLIETIVPKRINDIPLDILLKIRNKYDAERTAFFDDISNLTNSIPEIDNESALKDALNHHSKLILNKTKDLEKLYKVYKIETIYKFLNISLPTTIASFAEIVPNEVKPLVGVGGLLFGIFSAANSVKKEQLTLKENPKSYLLNLRSELSGGDIFNKINDTIKGIRKW